jgi:hypothetical protein
VRAVPGGERTGVLVLRVWVEPSGLEGEGLRARITAEEQLGTGERTTVVAGSVEQIVEIVRSWVEGFAASSLTKQ